MATDLDSTFDEQYMSINTKLKRRFMRKPNIAEASNEFHALAHQCELAEQPIFAGHCFIGAAKCEAAVGNAAGEAECFLSAARQFMKAEMKCSSLKCYNPSRENLEASIGCYLQALNKYPNQWSLRTSILMQMAHNLSLLGHKHEAIAYYEQAIDNIKEPNALKTKCLMRLLELNIQADRLDVALCNANNICDSNLDLPDNTLNDIQITRVLLSLLIETCDEEQPDSLKKLLQSIIDDGVNEDLPFSTETRLKLQSIILTYQRNDVESLVDVSAETNKLFTLLQQDLLIKLIRKMEKKI